MNRVQPDTTTEIPKIKGIYTALISQGGTAAPTAIVLNNTLGEITWTRDTNGEYYGTLEGAFPQSKTFIIINQNLLSGTIAQFIAIWNDANSIFLTSAIGGVSTDSKLANTPIEIRVYN